MYIRIQAIPTSSTSTGVIGFSSYYYPFPRFSAEGAVFHLSKRGVIILKSFRWSPEDPRVSSTTHRILCHLGCLQITSKRLALVHRDMQTKRCRSVKRALFV